MNISRSQRRNNLKSVAVFVLLVIGHSHLMALSAAEGDTRLPIPDPLKVKAATDAIRLEFKSDFADKTPMAAHGLSHKLISKLDTTADGDPMKYALLQEARRVAEAACDVATAMRASELLVARFTIDGIGLKVDSLASISHSAHSPDDLNRYAEAVLALYEQCIAQDRYADAVKLMNVASTTLRFSSDIPLAGAVMARAEEAGILQQEYKRIDTALKKVAAQPDDPASNTTVGRFLCLVKNDFEHGLPCLYKCADPVLKSLAVMEAAKPTNAEEQYLLGVQWYQFLPKAQPSERRAAQLRASLWFTRAYPRLEIGNKTESRRHRSRSMSTR
jgi:hypothetical protein